MNKKLALFLILLVALLTILPLNLSVAQGSEPSIFPPPPSAEELLKFGVPDSTPELNFLNPESPLYGKIPPPPPREDPPTIGNHTRLPSPSSVSDFWGTNIFQVNPAPSDVGAYAQQQIITNLTIPNNSDLYAPTLLGPNSALYEAVTAYHNWGGMTRHFAIYNHATHAWVLAKNLDSTFTSKYTSGGYYSVIIRKLSGTWRVYLYNYQTGLWESQVSGTGTGVYSYGWDIYESYLSGCSNLPVFRSRELQVVTTTGWKYITSTYGNEWTNLISCAYSKSWISQFYSWTIDPN